MPLSSVISSNGESTNAPKLANSSIGVFEQSNGSQASLSTNCSIGESATPLPSVSTTGELSPAKLKIKINSYITKRKTLWSDQDNLH